MEHKNSLKKFTVASIVRLLKSVEQNTTELYKQEEERIELDDVQLAHFSQSEICNVASIYGA